MDDTPHTRIVKYAKQSKVSSQISYDWVAHSSITAIVKLSSIFFQSSWCFFADFFAPSFFRLLLFALLSVAITITAVNKTRTEPRIRRFLLHKTVIVWCRDSDRCCGDGDDTKQFSWICIRNWIKMQSYYSPFAIEVNECSHQLEATEKCVAEICKRNLSNCFFSPFVPGKTDVRKMAECASFVRIFFFLVAMKRVKVCIYILQAYQGASNFWTRGQLR